MIYWFMSSFNLDRNIHPSSLIWMVIKFRPTEYIHILFEFLVLSIVFICLLRFHAILCNQIDFFVMNLKKCFFGI